MKVTKPEYFGDLRQLTEMQISNLVMSIALNGHVISHYHDLIWDFSPYIYTNSSGKTINFSSIRFQDDTCLTDYQHALLLASVKAYLYARLSVKDGRKTLGHKSIIGYWDSRLRPFITWMVDNGYHRFAEVTKEACLLYVKYCENCISKMPGSGKGLAKATLFVRFSLLDNLWIYRDYIPDSLPGHPWPGSSAISISGNSRVGGKDTTTEQIPDRIMAKLVQGALHYVTGDYGELLLDCRDTHDVGQSIDHFLEQFDLKDYRDHNQVLAEIRKLRTACFIVISAFSGMRISEVLSLELGCYYEHEGWDGATYGWLRGTTYKLEEDPRPAEWMVPPVVKQAVEHLARISSPVRSKLVEKIATLEDKISSVTYVDESLRHKDNVRLYELNKLTKSLFLLQYRGFNIMIDKSVRESLLPFCRHLGLKVEPTDLEQVRDKSNIKVGDAWPLTSHQFRKTFARYVSRCILGDVRYLRDHFKHWSLDMTLAYAWNEDDLLDSTLIDEILGEHQELQSDIVYGWVDFNRNQHLAGVGGKSVEKSRERSRVMVATDPRTVARQLSKGYFLRGLGHSWCTEKECRGKGIYSVTECADCENRVIDESHKPVWRGIRQQQIELLHIDDCGDPMWQGAADSLRYAENVLKDLGEAVEPYQIPPKPSERGAHA